MPEAAESKPAARNRKPRRAAVRTKASKSPAKKKAAKRTAAPAKVTRAKRSKKVSLPLIDDLPAVTTPPPAGQPQPLGLPFAGLLRFTDTVVAKAVGAYDSMFALEPEQRTHSHRRNAIDLARRGRLDDAQQALRQALAVDPSDAEALTELGVVYVRKKAPVAAVKTLVRAQEHGGSSFRLHRYLAEALAQQQEYGEALIELSEANVLKPQDPDTLHRIGTVLEEMGRGDEAVAAFEKAIELAPDEVRYHQSLGFTLETLGRRKEAVKRFKCALDIEHRAEAAATRRR